MKQKIIAIDFDGTITDDTPYPICGNLREEAAYYIMKLYDLDYTLVLWTARKGKDFTECINKLQSWGLLKYLHLPENVEGKIYADFYIDDKAIPGKINWNKLYNYICQNI